MYSTYLVSIPFCYSFCSFLPHVFPSLLLSSPGWDGNRTHFLRFAIEHITFLPPNRVCFPMLSSSLHVLFLLTPYALFLSFFFPYFDRDEIRFSTPPKSNAPRTTLYCTPGRSRTRPPRINTVECSCNPCPPSPGIYALTFLPDTLRIDVTHRCAEFGFLGAFWYTFLHTPRFCGHAFNAVFRVFRLLATRSFRTLCRLVVIFFYSYPYGILPYIHLLSYYRTIVLSYIYWVIVYLSTTLR